MSITSTYPRLRLIEAIVAVLKADSTLVSLTNDGELDDYGARHRIGEVLNEAALKGRTPYVGVHVINDFPLIPDCARAHMFRSEVLIWCYSTDRFKAARLGDRIQYLLTSPGDDDCNGYLDFTNQHIRNTGTEFRVRDGQVHDKNLDLYADVVQFEMTWSDVPCDLDVQIPQDEVCPLPQDPDPDLGDCIVGVSPTQGYVLVDEDEFPATVFVPPAVPETVFQLSTEGGTAPYTYSIVAGEHRDNFDLVGDLLTFTDTAPLTLDDEYTVVIRSTDASGNYRDIDVTVTVVTTVPE